MSEFESFQKIGRLSRDMVITEKLDGTNAQVWIEYADAVQYVDDAMFKTGDYFIKAGSRTRWITPQEDNFGFAAWAWQNAEELTQLGTGRHFGEWWGQGIQRKYGLSEKRWSLFNVRKWGETRPACCHVVPVLYRGDFSTETAISVLNSLGETGSVAAPGFMKPEGIVVFHTQSGALFKKTFEKDDAGKGREPEAAL